MRTPLFIALLTLLPTVAASEEPEPGCPDGSRSVGAAPPAGLERYCLDARDQAQGTWLNWYESGQMMSARQMRDGREHGLQRSWWPNGQLMMEGVSMEGQRVQGFRYWSITGQAATLPARSTAGPEKNHERHPPGSGPAAK